MRLNSIFVATMFALGSASVQAGDFTNVPYTTPNATVVSGANNTLADQLYINTTSATWLAGYTNLIAETIHYTATGGNGTLSLLSYRENDDIELAGNEIGDLYDLVYRDSRDGKLVFGTRVLLEVEDEDEEHGLVAIPEEDEEDEVELNFLYRAGFTNYATAVAWTFTGDNDLRLYNAARTASNELDGPFAADADLIRFQADISADEGNPFSGLYLVKTDATDYALSNSAIGYFQAGEEGQQITGQFIAGYVAAVPEPETYALMLAGLGLIGFSARRRS